MDFERFLTRDQIRTLPMRTPPIVTRQTTVAGAISQMKELNLGCAVIVDEMQRPVGIFTERSIINLLDQNESLVDCVVGDHTDPSFLEIRQDQPVLDVWNAICLEQFRFVCVIDDDEKLVGLTGQRGLSEYVSECFPWQVAVQRMGAKPWDEQREGA